MAIANSINSLVVFLLLAIPLHAARRAMAAVVTIFPPLTISRPQRHASHTYRGSLISFPPYPPKKSDKRKHATKGKEQNPNDTDCLTPLGSLFLHPLRGRLEPPLDLHPCVLPTPHGGIGLLVPALLVPTHEVWARRAVVDRIERRRGQSKEDWKLVPPI